MFRENNILSFENADMNLPIGTESMTGDGSFDPGQFRPDIHFDPTSDTPPSPKIDLGNYQPRKPPAGTMVNDHEGVAYVLTLELDDGKRIVLSSDDPVAGTRLKYISGREAPEPDGNWRSFDYDDSDWDHTIFQVSVAALRLPIHPETGEVVRLLASTARALSNPSGWCRAFYRRKFDLPVEPLTGPSLVPTAVPPVTSVISDRSVIGRSDGTRTVRVTVDWTCWVYREKDLEMMFPLPAGAEFLKATEGVKYLSGRHALLMSVQGPVERGRTGQVIYEILEREKP
jgi:hypothetical protein